MKRVAIVATLSIAIVLTGWFILRHRHRGAREERIEISATTDTLYYASIPAISVIALSAPRSEDTPPTQQHTPDSLYTFRDTVAGRWSATVTGSNVELRSLMLLDRHEMQTKYARPEWEVALKSGVSPNSFWAGVGVSRTVGRLTISLDGGYDPFVETPFVGLSASYRIWQE